MARFETWFDVNLKKAPSVQTIHGNVFSQDNLGNLVGVRVKNGSSTVSLSGAVTGYIIREDGKTVVVNGALSGNTAYIVLPESAYAVPGRIQIAIRLTSGTTKTVLLAAIGCVTRTSTDAIIDPGSTVPSLEQLLAKLDEMDAAKTAANTATANANGAAAAIDGLTVSATSVTGNPTATVSTVDGHKHITFGLAKGATGSRGPKGDTGDTGVGVADVAVLHALSTSDQSVTVPSGELVVWSEAVPEYIEGRYYWRRVDTVLDSGQTVTGTPCLDVALNDVYAATANANGAAERADERMAMLFPEAQTVVDYDSSESYEIGTYAVWNDSINKNIIYVKESEGVLGWTTATFVPGDLISYKGTVYRCDHIEDVETGEEDEHIVIVLDGDQYFPPYYFTPASITSVAKKEAEAAANKAKGIVAPVESSSTASANHASGSYLVYSNRLYRATRYITQGDTLTAGDNIVAAPTVEAVLRSHEADLDKVKNWAALPYEAGKTYPAGSYVLYADVLYKSRYDINTAPSSFMQSQWTAASDVPNALLAATTRLENQVNTAQANTLGLLAYNEGSGIAAPAADRAYEAGDFLILWGNLYEVTAAIAKDATISPGSNAQLVPGGLGGALAALKKQIAQIAGGG